MYKKILLTTLLLFGVGLFASSAQASLLNVGDTIRFKNGPGYGNGGEFKVDKAPFAAADLDVYRTFCVELTEYISYGTHYTIASFSDTTNATGKVLNAKVAVLFREFQNGSTDFFGSGVTYDHTGGATNEADGEALQQAIWNFMGWGNALNAKAVLFQTAATNFVTNNAVSSAVALAHVRVMNIVDLHGGNAQDQLYMVPEPGSVAIWGLAIAGLFAGSFLKRRRLTVS